MNTEVRFLLAIFLMLGVLVGTNLLFPPVAPELPIAADSASVADGGPAAPTTSDTATPAVADGAAPALPASMTTPPPVATETPDLGTPAAESTVPERIVSVTGPLYRFDFSNHGARLRSATLPQFESLAREGNVDLLPLGANGYLGQKLVVGSDTVDLRSVPFEVEPANGLTLQEGGGRESLTFTYRHPSGAFTFRQTYDFNPAGYIVNVSGSVDGALERPLLVTDLGDGLSFAEADSVGESRMMAYVYNHLNDGVRSTLLTKAEPTIVQGPLLWAAFRNKFFVMAILAESEETEADNSSYLGGVLIEASPLPERVRLSTAQSLLPDGSFAYAMFMGPQDYARLNALGQGMEEVNPYGWRFFRPIVRPFVAVIMWVLTFLHTNLSLGYGWVLIIFGVMMRVLLFPLNHKAMRAQLRNMAVQPLVQEIQKKYKDNPEKLQKEMMRLYKEHGFNPVAGCLPMLLPWPVLIALFFVFQNTIELRGVEFLWMPDLSAPDPLYLLPLFLGLSMFLMQLVSLKSLETPNPQMKMMMYIMPVMMVFIFFRLASGLNLYYATANIATIPQQMLIARERKKMRGKPPPTLKRD